MLDRTESVEAIQEPRRSSEGSTQSCPRRAFLTRLAMLSAGGFVLSGCSRGCSGKKHASRSETPSGDDPGSDARPPLPDHEPLVRVRIAAVRAGRGPSRAMIACTSGWVEMRFVESRRMPLHLQSPVTIFRRGGEWEIADHAGFRPSGEGLQPIELAPVDAEDLTVGDEAYPGVLRVVASGGDPGETSADFDVVNHVPLEAYLPGVLARELFRHWNAETFAAQAIAARSFACVEIYLGGGRHYDVTASQRSQMYGGQTTLSVARGAATRTRGVVLTFEDALVPGYYSSCCGGIAANAVDAISAHRINDIAPLRSRSDPDACTEAPVYRWRIDRSVEAISRRVAAFGTARRDDALGGLGLLRAIEVEEQNEHGRPTRFVLRDDRGQEASIAARRLRSAIDFEGGGLGSSRAPLRSSFVQVTGEGARFGFDGRGFGHGVGLCQYGAQALAERGLQYRAILGMFYPRADLQSAYS